MYVIVVILCLITREVWGDNVKVTTKFGTIVGRTEFDHSTKLEYETFYGIPYASVNRSNPFGRALIDPPLTNPFYATKKNIICPQLGSNISNNLDCLVLNIIKRSNASTSDPLPILVWFHGGAFNYGYGNQYGGKYLAKHNIMVVTVNYRLGPYGFMCLNHSLVPGNQGLKDQVAALKWIHSNIVAFGGNPNKITIAGQNAGAVSVHTHLFSGQEKLFDKVIMQSGTILVEGMYTKPDTRTAIKIAKYLGHNADSTKHAIEYLASQDPLRVLEATEKLRLLFRPCQEHRSSSEKPFILEDPLHFYSAKSFSNISFLQGYNSREKLASHMNKSEKYVKDIGVYFYERLKKNFRLPKEELHRMAKIVYQFYLDDIYNSTAAVPKLIDFDSDFIINYPMEASIESYLRQGAKKVYKYLFSYTSRSPFANLTEIGASHGEELKYLFEVKKGIVNDEDIKIREIMTTMWAQFVKTGNPTSDVSEKWIPLTSTTEPRPYMDISIVLSTKYNPFHDRMAFWELFWHTHIPTAFRSDYAKTSYSP